MTADRITAIAKVRELARAGTAREVRIAACLSIEEVASAIGVAPTTVWRWENGQRRPHGSAALRYGKLLNKLSGGTQ